MTSREPALHALVLADGERPARAGLDAAWPGWGDAARLVVAADGGVRLARELGLRIDLWVGDGDSAAAEDLDALRAAGVPLDLVARDKDESDTELALLAALRRGATDVTIVGGLGGRRFDHAMANVLLLGHPAAAGRAVRLIDERTRVTMLVAGGAPRGAGANHAAPADVTGDVTVRLLGRIGDLVSLLPLGDSARGVATTGLRYELANDPLEAGPARGLSNVRTAAEATVSIRIGRLLIVESP
ncbi:MAG TPA: thiamine diphosphokinase, partial [Candidatus Limnocylindrales bacterium]